MDKGKMFSLCEGRFFLLLQIKCPIRTMFFNNKSIAFCLSYKGADFDMERMLPLNLLYRFYTEIYFCVRQRSLLNRLLMPFSDHCFALDQTDVCKICRSNMIRIRLTFLNIGHTAKDIQ